MFVAKGRFPPSTLLKKFVAVLINA